MKNLSLICIIAAFAGSAVAAVPYDISIGSGDGSLVTEVYSDGYINGDDATFDPAGAAVAATTVWRNCFMVYNATDDAVFWADQYNDDGHTPEVPDGTVVATATGLTNTGMDYGNDLTSDLDISLSQPTVGQSAAMTFEWTFSNAAATAKNVRIIWFLDSDCYLDTNAYNDDVTVRLLNTLAGSGSAVAIGQGTVNASVDGNLGILAQSSVEATSVYAITDTGSVAGSAYYWTNEKNFLGIGPSVNNNIAESIANTVQNDADDNGASDISGDSGLAIQVDLEIAPSGSQSVSFVGTWGADTTYTALSSVNNWTLY